MRLRYWTLPFGAVLGLFSTSLLAQDDAAQTERRFDVERVPLSQPGRVIPQFDPLALPPAAGSVAFKLNAVELIGNTIIDDAALAAIYADALGTTVSVGQIFAIANSITAFYGQQGYPLTRAIVPAQEIDDAGRITIRVVEGFIDQVVVPEEAASNALLEAHARAIEAEQPISNATLERHLLLPTICRGLTLDRS